MGTKMILIREISITLFSLLKGFFFSTFMPNYESEKNSFSGR